MTKAMPIAPVNFSNTYHERDEAGSEFYTPAPIQLDDFLKKIEVFAGIHRKNVYIYANNAGLVVLRQNKADKAKLERESKKLAFAFRSVYVTPNTYDKIRALAFQMRISLTYEFIGDIIGRELAKLGRNLKCDLPKIHERPGMPEGLSDEMSIQWLDEQLRIENGTRTKLISVHLRLKDDDKIRLIALKRAGGKISIVISTLLERGIDSMLDSVHATENALQSKK